MTELHFRQPPQAWKHWLDEARERLGTARKKKTQAALVDEVNAECRTDAVDASELSRFFNGHPEALTRWLSPERERASALERVLRLPKGALLGKLREFGAVVGEAPKTNPWHPDWPEIAEGSVVIEPPLRLIGDADRADGAHAPAVGGVPTPSDFLRVVEAIRASAAGTLGHVLGLPFEVELHADPGAGSTSALRALRDALECRGLVVQAEGDDAPPPHAARVDVRLWHGHPAATLDRAAEPLRLQLQPWGTAELRAALDAIESVHPLAADQRGRAEAWLEAAESTPSLLGPSRRPGLLLGVLRSVVERGPPADGDDLCARLITAWWQGATRRLGQRRWLLEDWGLHGLHRVAERMLVRSTCAAWWSWPRTDLVALLEPTATRERRVLQALRDELSAVAAEPSPQRRQRHVEELRQALAPTDGDEVLALLIDAGLMVAEGELVAFVDPVLARLLATRSGEVDWPEACVLAPESTELVQAFIQWGHDVARLSRRLPRSAVTAIAASRLVIEAALQRPATALWSDDERRALRRAWAGVVLATWLRFGDDVDPTPDQMAKRWPTPPVLRQRRLLREASGHFAGVVPDLTEGATFGALRDLLDPNVAEALQAWTAQLRAAWGVHTLPPGGLWARSPASHEGNSEIDWLIATVPHQLVPFLETDAAAPWLDPRLRAELYAGLERRAEAGCGCATAWFAGAFLPLRVASDCEESSGDAGDLTMDPRAWGESTADAPMALWLGAPEQQVWRWWARRPADVRDRLLCLHRLFAAVPAGRGGAAISVGSRGELPTGALAADIVQVFRRLGDADLLALLDRFRPHLPLAGWTDIPPFLIWLAAETRQDQWLRRFEDDLRAWGDRVRVVFPRADPSRVDLPQESAVLVLRLADGDADGNRGAAGHLSIERIERWRHQIAVALANLGDARSLMTRWLDGPAWELDDGARRALRMGRCWSRLWQLPEPPGASLDALPVAAARAWLDACRRQRPLDDEFEEASPAADVVPRILVGENARHLAWIVSGYHGERATDSTRRLAFTCLWHLANHGAAGDVDEALVCWFESVVAERTMADIWAPAPQQASWPHELIAVHREATTAAMAALIEREEPPFLAEILAHLRKRLPEQPSLLDLCAPRNRAWDGVKEGNGSAIRRLYELADTESDADVRTELLRRAQQTPALEPFVCRVVAGMPSHDERAAWLLRATSHPDWRPLLDAQVAHSSTALERDAWATHLLRLAPDCPVAQRGFLRWQAEIATAGDLEGWLQPARWVFREERSVPHTLAFDERLRRTAELVEAGAGTHAEFHDALVRVFTAILAAFVALDRPTDLEREGATRPATSAEQPLRTIVRLAGWRGQERLFEALADIWSSRLRLHPALKVRAPLTADAFYLARMTKVIRTGSHEQLANLLNDGERASATQAMAERGVAWALDEVERQVADLIARKVAPEHLDRWTLWALARYRPRWLLTQVAATRTAWRPAEWRLAWSAVLDATPEPAASDLRRAIAESLIDAPAIASIDGS